MSGTPYRDEQQLFTPLPPPHTSASSRCSRAAMAASSTQRRLAAALHMITEGTIMASNTGRMSISVSPEKQAKLDAIAATADRSRSYIVNEAIDHYLDLYEWQTRRIEERLERAQSGEAKWIPHDEVFDRLEAKIKDRIERGQS